MTQDNHGDENQRMRKRSGEETSSDPLVTFIYVLMRDHVTPGVVEETMLHHAAQESLFTNGWLARYAKDVAARLRGPETTLGPAPDRDGWRAPLEWIVDLEDTPGPDVDPATFFASQFACAQDRARRALATPPDSEGTA